MTASTIAERKHEDGFATIWTLVAIAVVIVVTGVAVMLGGVGLTRHRAAAAADAAALAAAMTTIEGPAAACQRAAVVATLNHGELAGCTVSGAFATVTVDVRLPGPLARFGRAAASSRAGPGP
jgi:secretion/DNA translocation related TadE-like protein